MSITKGLVELKLLDKRIEKSINDAMFVTLKVKGKSIANYQSEEEFSKATKAKHQSIDDLIKRRDEIKTAIVQSNAKTLVKIAGNEMTVASAIEKRNHSIRYEQLLLNRMKQTYAYVTEEIELINKKVEAQIEKQTLAIVGKEGDPKSESIKLINDMYWDTHQAQLVDPLSIRNKIEELEQFIDGFLAEVDTALSESNAITVITVS